MRKVVVVLLPVFALVIATTASNPAKAEIRQLNQELRVAQSLEQAIRDSEALSFLTKLNIESRFEKVRTAARAFRQGDVPEYDLRVVFNSAMNWLELLFAKSDPVLRTQLVEARPALWKIATEE